MRISTVIVQVANTPNANMADHSVIARDNANMADHSVIAWDKLHESEASQASVFCFDNASPKKVLLHGRSGLFYFAMPTSF